MRDLPKEAGQQTRAAAEQFLLDQARVFHPKDLARLGRKVLEVVDPELADRVLARQLADEEAKAEREREVWLYEDPYSVSTWLRGKLDPVTTEMLRTALEPLAKPRLVPKGSRRLGGLDEQIISLYAGGMTVRDIQHHLVRTLGTELSHETISKITDAVLEEVKAWQSRPLEEIYPIIYLDALVVKVRDGHHVRNRSAHIAVGVDIDGVKHVLGIWVQASEGAKFWAGVCAELRNRGVRDVLIVCCDGLSGFAEAIEATWPQTTVQTCVVHLIRAAMRFVSYGDRKKNKPMPTTADGPDPRSRSQRLGDGFAELLRRYLNAGASPTQGGERPHVVITIDHDRLVNGTGTGTLLHTGTPVSARTAQEYACDAKISWYTPGNRNDTAGNGTGRNGTGGNAAGANGSGGGSPDEKGADQGRAEAWAGALGPDPALHRQDPPTPRTPRPRLRLPRLRPPTTLDPRPPHHRLEPRRTHHRRQRRPALRPPPPTHPPRTLDRHHRPRRPTRIHPTPLDRPPTQTTPQPPTPHLKRDSVLASSPDLLVSVELSTRP